MYWCVNTERYTHSQTLTACRCAGLSLSVSHSLVRSHSHSLPFSFALHVCVVAVAVCTVCLYPRSSVQKSMGRFGCVQGCNCSNMKNPKNDCFNVQNRCTHTLTHSHTSTLNSSDELLILVGILLSIFPFEFFRFLFNEKTYRFYFVSSRFF